MCDNIASCKLTKCYKGLALFHLCIILRGPVLLDEETGKAGGHGQRSFVTSQVTTGADQELRTKRAQGKFEQLTC